MFPAMSVALTRMVLTAARVQEKFPLVTVPVVPLQVSAAMPLSASEVVPVTVACGVVIVDPLAGEMMLRIGALLSIFNVTDAVAEFPAVSVAVLDTTWLAPSVVVITGCGQVIVPEPPIAGEVDGDVGVVPSGGVRQGSRRGRDGQGRGRIGHG